MNNPAKVGVYKTNSFGDPCDYFQHWNGEFWGLIGVSEKNAIEGKDFKSKFQKVEWREVSE